MNVCPNTPSSLSPASDVPPGPRLRDWLLFAGILAFGISELAVCREMSWKSPAVLLTLALTLTVPWRRSHALTVVVLGFGATGSLSALELVLGAGSPPLHMSVFMLLLPYELVRWRPKRDIVIGLAVVFVSAALGLWADRAPLKDVLGASAVLLIPVALGAAARYRSDARKRELEHVKLQEREQLARDLHDTVAHHVSAIAVRAQAGLASASANPAAQQEALRVIEAEATRTLEEMRAMVRLLRRHEGPELSPTPDLHDLERLASVHGPGPAVDVEVASNVGELSPAISAALYRLAQESVTNSRRHARRATRIAVEVTANDTSVHLRVRDDGERIPPRSPAKGGYAKAGYKVGYGVRGMVERAALLGGICQVGPGSERGWTVDAILPRNGPRS